jgi:hypothetical protein
MLFLLLFQLMTSIHWTPDMQNEEMFRVIEYGAMSVSQRGCADDREVFD